MQNNNKDQLTLNIPPRDASPQFVPSPRRLPGAQDNPQSYLDVPQVDLGLRSSRLKEKEMSQKMKNQVKFIKLESTSTRPEVISSQISSAKNLIYRSPGTRYVSQQKKRKALEVTKMLERERRFNKMENEKKNQRLARLPIGGGERKFNRKEHEKEPEGNHKFRRGGSHSSQKKIKRLKSKPKQVEPELPAISQKVDEQNESKLLENSHSQLSIKVQEPDKSAKLQQKHEVPTINVMGSQAIKKSPNKISSIEDVNQQSLLLQGITVTTPPVSGELIEVQAPENIKKQDNPPQVTQNQAIIPSISPTAQHGNDSKKVDIQEEKLEDRHKSDQAGGIGQKIKGQSKQQSPSKKEDQNTVNKLDEKVQITEVKSGIESASATIDQVNVFEAEDKGKAQGQQRQLPLPQTGLKIENQVSNEEVVDAVVAVGQILHAPEQKQNTITSVTIQTPKPGVQSQGRLNSESLLLSPESAQEGRSENELKGEVTDTVAVNSNTSSLPAAPE